MVKIGDEGQAYLFIMDRDEAIARGLRVHETQHSMKRRSPWHDYHGKGTYMLTLVVEGRMPLLGKLWGRVDARPGDGDAPKVKLSELGLPSRRRRFRRFINITPRWRFGGFASCLIIFT